MTSAASLRRMKETERTVMMQLESQRREYEDLRRKIDQGRRYRHDMRHHLRVLEGLFDEARSEEGLQYLSTLNGQLTELEQEACCENATVNAVLLSLIHIFFDAPRKKKTRDFIHKMKYFYWQIRDRDFDLMQLQGNVRSFAHRYGLDDKKAYRLQLCTEELIYEMLDYGQADGTPDIQIQISFDERDKCTLIELRSKGKRYDPFEAEPDDETHLGVTILKNTAKRLDYRFDGENNCFEIEL